LPTDFPRPSLQTFSGESVFTTVSGERLEQIRQFNSQQGVSLFMTLVAAIKMLLYRYTGQEDIIVGSPVAGRIHADLEDQFGLYLNTLALRDQLHRDTTVAMFLQQAKQTITEAFEHQIYPFDRLVDELDLPRDFSRSPLFDVLVNLQLKNEAFSLDMGSLAVTGSFVEDTFIALFDLNFMFGESENELLMEIQYNSGLFTQETVQKMGTEFILLLEHITERPEVTLKEIRTLLTSPEEVREQADFLQSTMELSEDF
jgi:non-ribosomal peptide synthetase component F